MILVTGATGNVGSAVVAELVAKGVDVRALVHDEAKVNGLREAGVEVFIGDLAEPETLDGAFDGVDKVFLITPVSPDAAELARNAIDAAKRGGSPHIVRLSALKSAHDSPTRIGRLHAETEDDIRASGLPYTFVKPHFFMQNTIMAAPTVQTDGNVYMAFKDGKLGMVDIRDVAGVAVEALTSDGHEGKEYTPTGPASISFHEVAERLADAVGKEVNYVDVPPEGARQALLDMGLPEWLADGYTDYFRAYSEGWGDFTTDDVQKVTGQTARSYQTFASDFAQLFGGTV